MIPQPMVPPQYYYDWFDPQNNPYWAYYYQGYDPNCFGYPPNRSRSQTPQPSMTQSIPTMPQSIPAMPPAGNVPYPYYPYPPPPPFMWYPPFMGFRPISSSRETTPCFSESERYQKTPTNDDRNRRAVSCTPTCCQHAKPFKVDDLRNKFHTLEEPLINLSSSSETEDEDYLMNPLSCDPAMRKSMISVPSVTNIHLYSEENADLPLEELQAKPIIQEEDDDKSEASDETTEVDDEISQDSVTAELHYPHQLSVIYEENDESLNNERRLSNVSRCSTLSDCSTTLMEEDNISVDGSCDDLDDENSNSVTVRLPLKFSFTRSKDNLVNTTMTVGESESEFTENNSSHSKSFEDVEPLTPEVVSNDHELNVVVAPDVSVTFRLKSKSKSKTPERCIAPEFSLPSNNSFDSDPDCSVSISLSRKPKLKELRALAEEKSDSSSENHKQNIDSSLYTSIDAFEEIKRGMAEITNSLCSKLCTLRKSALNIPENDPYRSSSTSQIESIETDESDSEIDMSLSFDDNRMDEINEQPQLIDIGYTNGESFDNVQEETNVDEIQNRNDEDDVDFWSQLSSANKNYEAPDLSKTSTRSSRYWFDDDCDETDVQPDAPELQADSERSEEIPKLIEKTVEPSVESSDVDFWGDYDDNKLSKFRANDYFTAQDEPDIYEEKEAPVEKEVPSTVEEYESESEDEVEEQPKIIVNIEVAKGVVTSPTDDELASDEEWTEEEVEETDNEEPQVELKAAAVIAKECPPKAMPVTLTKAEITDDETEYEEETECEEETEYEERKPEPEVKQEAEPKTEKVPVEEPSEDEASDSEESEGEESSPELNKSSSSKITKGKSLVNVNSFVASGSNSRDRVSAMVHSINEAEDSEESEYSSAEEADDNEPNNLSALLAKSSNQSLQHSNDDCQLLTRNEDSHEVLLPTLTTIQSMDSKSNLTSESGISFEQHDPDSEDGYEEDSDEEAPHEDEKTVTKESLRFSPDFDAEKDEDEVKVNVKGKISMFERAMSEEPIERSAKEAPRVQSKYSFKHRESSEPPVQRPAIMSNLAVPQRAVSEVKEMKNQKLLDLINQHKSMPTTVENDEESKKKSVKERVSSFEASESDASERRETFKRYGNSKKPIPLVRSIDESGEEDSGVTSDFCKQLSENETDSENFPELRKLSRYQRASTHSRLFKLLGGGDDDEDYVGENEEMKEIVKVEQAQIPYKSKKIIHNVSVTRRQNPKAALEAETMEERRRRLCLPLSHQSSSGAESMSSSTTPSPTPGAVNEKLVNELVQSLLLQKKGRIFKNLPIEKLHAAAIKILQEDVESNGTFSSADESTIPTVDSTPALTPQEFRNNSSYAEYYDSWDNKQNEVMQEDDFSDLNLIQSKAFKNLQDQQINASKKLWSVRCPRILSSKSINKDLARLSEVRESESPESNHSRSPSIRSLSREPMSGEKLNIQERHRAKNCNT